MNINKYRKIERNEKINAFDKKFENENQINDSIKELQKYLTEIIDKTVSWTKKSRKNKFF